MPRAKHLEFNSKDYQHLPTSDIIGNSSDQSTIYYNVQIFNNSTNYDKNGNPIPTVLAVPADFSQQRSKPYILKPSAYFVSVPYFRLDSNSFPTQIVQPVVNSSYTVKAPIIDTGLEGIPTVYAMYLQVHDGPNIIGEYFQQILWKPLDDTLQIPTTPIRVEDIQDEYFWNYTYDYFIDLMNDTLSYCIDALGYVNDGNLGKPFFYYDSATELINYQASLPFMTDISGEDIYTSKYTYKLFFNEQLYKLVETLPTIFGERPLTPNIPDTAPFYGYQILAVPNPGYTNIITLNDGFDGSGNDIKFIVIPQEFQSVSLWSPVVSIVFTTPNLTVCNELNAIPVVFGIRPTTFTNNNDSLNILYEHIVGKRADPVIKNFAKAEYRLTDLFSIQPESQLIIETFWKDTFGILHRFYIEQGSGFNMKLLFRRTDFNAKK
jgi:hypothetical protein